MGIEDVFMLRFGDDGRPTNQLQVAFAKKVSEEATAPARGKIPADADNRFNLTPFAWHHIAVSFDKGTVSVYIDGKLKETAKAAVSGPDGAPVTIENVNFAIPHSDETEGKPRCFWIGLLVSSGNGRRALLRASFRRHDERVRIWNKALTAEEIGSENHFYKIDPASEGLVAYWKFDDRVPGKNIRDYGPYGFDLKTESDETG